MAAKKKSWRDIFEGAVVAASEDPNGFVDGLIAKGRSAGETAEALYQKLKDNPTLPRKIAISTIVGGFAKRIRQEGRF